MLLRTTGVNLTEELVVHFVDAWSKFDPAGSKFIPHVEFPDLLLAMPPPLGTGRVTELLFIKHFEFSGREFL